ncbi:DUF305 domain-containing protein [Microbacterium sp. SLBN-146]|uniref:DUF305 domain-containing protein n=1 Tax=Microbacterium sp. SLBN-146 TaxID=2768457 RepID=UPI001151016B|nr:DUF305 domain-containing protein [Microbacterium sp. SLBN-146]TQJ30622.1 uncharacterized protein (DUF305 family) [Microbacterium sp. SLBN-146]
MSTATKLAALGAAALLAISLAGCTGAPEQPVLPTAPVVQLGGPGEPNRTLSPEEAAQLTAPPYVQQDVDFIRDMLHHHSQAIVMTGYVDERTDNESVQLLAERMSIGQEQEMEYMERWLQERGEPVRDPDQAHGEHNMSMPGLLTDAELADLEAARGDDFDRLFLEYMIKHHTGAVSMVTTLYAEGGGNETPIDTIAREIEADQNIEIIRMNEMLAEMS